MGGGVAGEGDGGPRGQISRDTLFTLEQAIAQTQSGWKHGS